jgi:hypothetical protein
VFHDLIDFLSEQAEVLKKGAEQAFEECSDAARHEVIIHPAGIWCVSRSHPVVVAGSVRDSRP